MPHPRFTNEAIARRGEQIYTTQLRDRLEKQNLGQVVIIDIETGDYENGDDSLAANNRALAKRPEAALYGVRVGSAFVESIGGPKLLEEAGATMCNGLGGKGTNLAETSNAGV